VSDRIIPHAKNMKIYPSVVMELSFKLFVIEKF